MVKDIFIFRHGQTDNNLNQICQGYKTDAPLNETGISQADTLGRQLAANVKLEVIYASPLQRAYQTAVIVKSYYPDIAIRPLPELHEGSFGDAEGQKINVIEKLYPGLWKQIISPTKDTWSLKFPGDPSESKQEIFCRVLQGLQKLASIPEKNIGICSHAGVISALACGLELKNVQYHNCSILHLCYDTTTAKIFQPE